MGYFDCILIRLWKAILDSFSKLYESLRPQVPQYALEFGN